jgi:hypothetical protein
VHGLGTTGTKTDDRKVGKTRSVTEIELYQRTHRVELLWCHGSVVAAALAREVLAIAGYGKCVKPWAVPKMHVSNEADFVKRLQVAVDGGDIRRWYAAPDALSDLLRGHRPVGGQQRLDDQPACGRHAKTPLTHERHSGTQVPYRRRRRVGL